MGGYMISLTPGKKLTETAAKAFASAMLVPQNP
jgi:hypothetical protein